MNTRTERLDPIIGAIYKANPSALDVYVDGEEKPKRVPLVGRQRWAKAKRILDALPWTRVDALDKGGNVVDSVTRDDDDDDDDVYVDPVDQAERIARLIADARQQQAKEDRLLFADHFKATAEMLDALTGGVRQLNETFTLALKVAAIAQAAPAPTGDPMDDKMKDIIMGMVAKQMGIDPSILGGAFKMAGAAKPPPPPNGANGTRPPPPKQPPPNGAK